MAATPSVESSQFSLGLAGNPVTDLQLSGFGLLAATAQKTDAIHAAQFRLDAAYAGTGTVFVSQTTIMAAILGAPTYRKARAWYFSLDGHDFYVLRIGDYETLVLDVTTGEIVPWDSLNRPTWRAHLGQNWIGMARRNYLGGAQTNVVAGDDTFGVLWTLDPASGIDDAPLDGQDPQLYERVVTAGVAARMRVSPRQNVVFLVLRTGAPELEAPTIELRLSDDNGNTFYSAGTVDIVPGRYDQEIMWRSLGVIRAPGRIMEFRDRGASVALISLDTRLSPGGAYDTEGEA